MQRQEITDDVALAEEVEQLIIEAWENGLSDHEIEETLERQKQLLDT